MQMQPNSLFPHRDDNWQSSDSTADQIDLESVFGIIRRQWHTVALFMSAFAILGIIYIFNATPLYTAQTSVLMDRGSNSMLTQLSDINPVFDDEPSVLSQVELLQSEAIARSVVLKNKLDEDAEFMDVSPSLFRTVSRTVGQITGWIWPRTPDPEAIPLDVIEARRDAAVAKLIANVSVARAGRTYVLDIMFKSPSAALSARIANAIGEAYISDKLDSKFEATRRAADWMQQRITELRQRAVESDLAVQKFKTANNIVATGELLLTDQQLAQLNTAWGAAQTAVASARAKYDRVQSILAAGDVQAIVPEVLASSTINELRTKYLEVAKRQSELSAIIGPNHERVVRLKQEMAEYEKQMLDELGRIAQSFKSQLDVAVSQERDLAGQVASATSVSASANEVQVQLRELERESDTYRNLYQSFLERYQQAIQQQSFPITDARIISTATPPSKASSPNKPLLMAVFVLLGAVVGSAFSGFREFRDRFFRTGEQCREELGLELLGIAPLVKDVRNVPLISSGRGQENGLRKTSTLSSYVVNHPQSAFAESLRSAKIAADLALPGKTSKIIGVVSTLPDEGKSTIAVNFAQLLAMSGHRTLLIDADLRNPGATRSLAQHASAGLVEALIEGVPVETLLLPDLETNLAFLPAVVKQRIPHSSELLNSSQMHRLLAMLSTKFDYIVVDLPPLAPIIDTRAMSAKIDSFIFVVEWGKTARRTVRHILMTEPRVAEKCIGVLLNKVDMEKMRLYSTHGSIEHYFSRYSRYYHEN